AHGVRSAQVASLRLLAGRRSAPIGSAVASRPALLVFSFSLRSRGSYPCVEESQGGQQAVSPLFWKECDMRRRSEVLVTEFLRDALAVDALVVPELEARARAIGLLGQCQSITHIRVFKRAKKSLGIRSRRTGFGARSQWL